MNNRRKYQFSVELRNRPLKYCSAPSSHSLVPRVYEEPKELSQRQQLLDVVPQTLKPIDKPGAALLEAEKKVQSIKVVDIIEAIRLGCRLCRFHSEDLLTKKREVNQIILSLLVYLSSNDPLLSRGSALFFKDLFKARLYYVHDDVQRIIRALLTKSASSNKLVSIPCISALSSAIDNIPVEKLHYICGEDSLKHQNVRCQAIAANLVYRFILRVGRGKFISQHFPLLVVPLTELLLVGDSLVRKGAQNVFVRVLNSPEARSILRKQVPSSLLQSTQKILDELIDQALVSHNKPPKNNPYVARYQDWNPQFQRQFWLL